MYGRAKRKLRVFPSSAVAEHKTLNWKFYKYDISDHTETWEFRLEQPVSNRCSIHILRTERSRTRTFSTYASVIRDGLKPDSICIVQAGPSENRRCAGRAVKTPTCRVSGDDETNGG